MATRLAAIGAALLFGGLINVTGFGKFTAPLGVVALACSGVLFARDRNSSRRR